MDFYDQRGEVENWIKELKGGFGMEWIPCGETYASASGVRKADNAVFFRLGVIAYNLLGAMKVLALPRKWHRHTRGTTIRWRLYQIAGQVMWQARRVVLRLAATAEKMAILLTARRRIQQLGAT